MQIGIAFLNNLARYIKILSLTNSLGNYPANIFANEDKQVCARMFKTAASSRTLSKQIAGDPVVEYYAALKRSCFQNIQGHRKCSW